MLEVRSKPRWVLAEDRSFQARGLAAQAGIHPLTAQVLINRGVDTVEAVRRFLSPRTEVWHPGEAMLGMAHAADLLADAVRQQKSVCIHGDYDCDGVSATALLVTFLRDLKQSPLWYIPHRIDEGYGISAEGVRWAAEQGAALLVTVDCGSSSPGEVALARELGLQVIVTDHHRVPPVLPVADAFVNPQQPGCDYPFKKLSGVGVALKLVQATCARLGMALEAWREYLDLATLGTVGDVVSLTGENRMLVVEGLERLNRRPGLRALLEVTGTPVPVGARDVAFKVIPPINASGRLDHATTACRLLLESDPEQARVLAAQLVDLNVRRRSIEQEVTAAAREQVLARDTWRQDGLILEAAEGWHRGVVGIVASRLMDEFHVPTLVVSVEGELGKGSARSPHGTDIFHCLTAARDLLPHFGGHPRAGGFTVRMADFEAFRARLIEAVGGQVRAESSGPPVDAAVSLPDLSMELVRELESLAPFGEGNPEPRFALSQVRLDAVEMLKGLHARMTLSSAGTRARALKFGRAPAPAEVPPCGPVSAVVSPEREVWRGEERLTLRVHDMTEGGVAMAVSEHGRRLVDSRHVGDPQRYLHGLAQGNTGVVGLVRSVSQARTRFRHALFSSLEEAVRMLAVASPRIVLLPFSALKDAGEPGALEVVWLSPPPSLAALSSPLLERAARVHLLFTSDELEEERRFYQTATINQPRMEALYQGLRRQLADGPAAVSVGDLVGGSRTVTLNRVSAEAGLRVFEELGLVTRDASGAMTLVRGVKAELAASPTYRAYSTLAERFEEVQGILMRQPERLADVMWRRHGDGDATD